MKKQLLACGLGLTLISSTSAVLAEKEGDRQGANGGQRGNPEQRMQRMQQHLGLSDAQISQMREIRENGGSREDMRAVLSDEQRSTLQKHRAQRGGKGQGRQGQGRGPAEGSTDDSE